MLVFIIFLKKQDGMLLLWAAELFMISTVVFNALWFLQFHVFRSLASVKYNIHKNVFFFFVQNPQLCPLIGQVQPVLI